MLTLRRVPRENLVLRSRIAFQQSLTDTGSFGENKGPEHLVWNHQLHNIYGPYGSTYKWIREIETPVRSTQWDVRRFGKDQVLKRLRTPNVIQASLTRLEACPSVLPCESLSSKGAAAAASGKSASPRGCAKSAAQVSRKLLEDEANVWATTHSRS